MRESLGSAPGDAPGARKQATEANGDRPLWLYTTGPAELVVIENPDGGWYIADYKNDLHAITQTK